jgi:hypothetical protein
MLFELLNSVALAVLPDAGAYAYYLALMSIGSLKAWRVR